MQCPKCGSKTGNVYVDVGLKIPAAYTNLISKTMLRRSDISLQYANWPSARFICDKCNYMEKGL